MSPGFQVVVDAADTKGLAGFWREALGYVDQPPPGDFAGWDEFLDSINWPADDRDARWAIIDPDGVHPRLLFEKVPESKTAKNRVHLDINIGAGLTRDERPVAVRAAVDRLTGLGAAEQRTVDEHGEFWIVMTDPEGNEFCVH